MPVTELLICGEVTDAPEGLTFGGGARRAAKVSSVDWPLTYSARARTRSERSSNVITAAMSEALDERSGFAQATLSTPLGSVN